MTMPAANPMFEIADPFGIFDAYSQVQQAWLCDPVASYEALCQFTEGYATITCQTWQRCMGVKVIDAIEPCEYDARFQDPIWFDNPLSDFIKNIIYYAHAGVKIISTQPRKWMIKPNALVLFGIANFVMRWHLLIFSGLIRVR